MANFNWRTLLTIGVLMVAVVIVVNLAFSAMWIRSAPTGAYGVGPYGPGPMMAPWMWGGMGFFWIFPLAGFLFMLVFLALIGQVFYGNTGQARPPSVSYGPPHNGAPTAEACRTCGRVQSNRRGWPARIAEPHARKAAEPRARPSSHEPHLKRLKYTTGPRRDATTLG